MFDDVLLFELQESSIWNKTYFIFSIMTSLLSLLPQLRLYAPCLIIEILTGFLGEQNHWKHSSFIAITTLYVQYFLLIFWSSSQLLSPQIYFFLFEGLLEGSVLSISSNNKDISAAPSEGFCIQLFASSLQIWFCEVNGKHTSVILCTDSNLIKIKSYWFFCQLC